MGKGGQKLHDVIYGRPLMNIVLIYNRKQSRTFLSLITRVFNFENYRSKNKARMDEVRKREKC